MRGELPSKLYIFGVIGTQNFLPNLSKPLKRKYLNVIFIFPKNMVNNMHFGVV